ncbi:23S rRNA (adenine(2030)-N(6))-methyltransferase RlmJ [Acidihalobacter prosperus]
MFAYQHGFHAGNFADVLKHVVLLALLDALRRKDKPFFVLDTHGGDGLYALDSAQAQKVGEFRDGVARLWGEDGLHPAIDAWLEAVAVENPGGELRRYPGSPRLIAHRLREQDRLVAVEGHNSVFPRLVENLHTMSGARAEHGDGYRALKAHLPPACGRGLVLIDPSYETRGEFQRLTEALKLIHKRFRQGLVAVWYPLLPNKPAQPWLEEVATSGIPDILLAELSVADASAGRGLYGSGMLLINPPWGLESVLREVLPLLHARLSRAAEGGWRVSTLVDEQGRRG